MPNLSVSDRLNQARDAALAGRYAEALREYVWYHNNALKYEPAQRGVRLSFALGYWEQLAEVYPPAKRKLMAIRDHKTKRLLEGSKSGQLFFDVRSINRVFGEGQKTYQLLKVLEVESPELAEKCGFRAIDDIVGAGDFEMAKRHWPRPESGLLQFSDDLNDDVSKFRADPNRYERALMAYTQIYCNRVQTTMRIAEGLGFSETAELTREWAVALVKDRHVRNKVQRILLASPS